MKRQTLLAMLLVFAALLSAARADEADSQFARSVDRRYDDRVEIVIENLTTFELTMTFRLDVQDNVVPDRDLPLTMVLPGSARVTAFRLRLPRNGARWSYNYRWTCQQGNMNARHDAGARYRLPYTAGEGYRVMQGFNGSFSHFGDNRYAIDWDMREGTEVRAAREGVVLFTIDRFTRGGPDRSLRNSSNRVVVRHSDGTYGEYNHLRHQGVRVKVGDTVQTGDLLGYSGATGFATGPHLHFIVYRPLNGDERETFPIKFQVAGQDEPVTLVEGDTYVAP